jgi:hypothetical protein
MIGNFYDVFILNLSGYSLISQTGLLSLILLCSIPVLTGLKWSPASFYISGLSVIALVTLPLLWIRLKADPVSWVVETILTSADRMKLVLPTL